LSAPLIAITDSSNDAMSTNQIEDDEDELDFALDEDMCPNISSEEVCFLNFLPIHVLHFHLQFDWLTLHHWKNLLLL
jgi:hypothetical protein